MKSSHIDPVCGMRVDSDRISTIHEGTRHVFCSTRCEQKFLADPSAYLEPLASGAGVGSPAVAGAKKDCCG